MMLTRLALQKFKRFDDLDLLFTPGVNVIKGPNESGKSSLIQGFLAGLFWKVTSTKQEVNECRSWGTDEGFILRLEGLQERQPWSLSKDFGSRTALLSYAGESTTDPQRINERIGEWLGLASEELYCSTAGIRQEEVQDLSSGRRQLTESLQTTIAGGGAGAAGALKDLKNVLDELNRGTKSPAKRPGLIAAAQAELNRLEQRRDTAREQASRKQESAGELAVVRERSAALRDEAGVLDRVIQESQEKRRLEEELERLRGDFQLAHREQQLLEECAELERQAASFAPVARVLEHRERLEELRRQGAGLEATRAGLEAELQRYKGELTAMPARERLMLVLSLVLVIAGLAGLFFSLLAVIPLGAGTVLALGLGTQRMVLRRSRRQAGGHLKRRIEDLGAEAHGVEVELKGLAHAAGCATVQDLWNLGAQFTAFEAMREANCHKMEALGLRAGDGYQRQSLNRLASDIAAKEARISSLAPTSLSGVDLRKAQLRRAQIGEELVQLDGDRIRLSMLTDSDDQEALLRLEEEIAEVSDRLAARQRQARVYELASELISEAARHTAVSMAEILKAEMGKHIAVITGGKYRRVKVDPETLQIQVFSAEKGGLVGTSALSHGTVDQLYLVARLSLMRNIAGGCKPPLLLDDSFVAFDRERLNRAMRLVRAFSKEYQVLLFTCYDTFDSFADNLVNLEQISRVRRLEF